MEIGSHLKGQDLLRKETVRECPNSVVFPLLKLAIGGFWTMFPLKVVFGNVHRNCGIGRS